MGDPTPDDERARLSRRVEFIAYGFGAVTLAGFVLLLLLFFRPAGLFGRSQVQKI